MSRIRAIIVSFVFISLFFSSYLRGQQIKRAEYFFDGDPGIGNATALSITQANTLDNNFSIPTSSLGQGIHILRIRVQDTDGSWSLAEGRMLMITSNTTTSNFNLTQAEYYYDVDPGFGSGNPLTITSSAVQTNNFTIPTTSLSPGIHNLYIRYRNGQGAWSLAYQGMVFIKSLSTTSIVAAEYYFDNDPGFGSGNSLTISSGSTINVSPSISTSNINEGIHQLRVRVKDSRGIWSQAESRLVFVSKSTQNSKIVDAEYFFDTEPGFGNGNALTVTANNIIDLNTLITNNLNPGFHQLYVRVKDSTGTWSMTSNRLVMVNGLESQKLITAIEYSFDSVPDFGEGNIVQVTPAAIIDHNFTIPNTIPDTFYHMLYTRVKSVDGRWSLLDSVRFKLESCVIPDAIFSLGNICLGETISLNSQSTGVDSATVYNWDIGNNGSIDYTIDDSISYQFQNIGSYDIKLSVSNFVCYDTLIKTVNVYPMPVINISTYGDSVFCPGQNMVFSANTSLGYNYQWLKNQTPITGAIQPIFQATDSGDYSLRVTTMHSCSDTSRDYNVGIYPLPNASITFQGTGAICQGDSILLSAPTGSGLTYEWFKNGSSISGLTSGSIYVKQSGDYSVRITNSNGCTSNSSSTTITVNPLPTAIITAGGSTTFCDGGSVNLYGTSGSGLSYDWLKDGISISGANSSSLNAMETGYYKLIVTNSSLCKDTSTSIQITVNPNPTAAITYSGNLVFCQGDSAVLQANTGTGLTYQWLSYGFPISGETNENLTAYQSGSYSIKTTNGFNCFALSSTIVITVNPNPFAQLIPLGSTVFCTGDSVKFVANSGSGLSYQWFKNSSPISGATLANYTAHDAGYFHVKTTNQYNCSMVSNQQNVVVNPIPTSTFSIAPTICSNDTVTVTYTGTGTSGGYYYWNFGGATVLNGSGSGPLDVIFTGSGNQTVSLTVVENGCASPTTFGNINLISVPAFISSGNTSVCQGDSIMFYANNGQNLVYQWFANGSPISGQTSGIYTSKITGDFFVVVTDTLKQCYQKSNVIQAQVNTTDFSLAFSANQTSFTQPPFNVNFSNQTPQLNSYSFLWNFDDGTTSTLFNPIHGYNYNGIYTISLLAENNSTGCRDTLVKTDYISCAGGLPNPCNVVSAITPAGSTTICFNDSIMLSATVGANYSYQWVRNGIIIQGATDSIFWAKSTGSYSVMVSDQTCSQASNPFQLNHYPNVAANVQSSGTLVPCSNDSLNLHLNGFYSSYLWSTGQTSPDIYVTQTGYYTVTVTDNFNCTFSSNPFTVNASYYAAPEICMVSVDTSNHNQIIWEKDASSPFDSVYVYAETNITNQYLKIGAVPYSSPGVFVDNSSNPDMRAYRYKLAGKDSCGALTLLSNYHKTMHLTINAGLNGAWNLIWDPYFGFTYNTYLIYRGTTAQNLQLLAQLPSSVTSYTDLNPPAGNVFYQIEIVKVSPCYPDSLFAKANTNYNTSRSNKADNSTINPVYLAADFNANSTNGQWPLPVQFTDISTGNPNAWKWDFGDGNSSIEQNPVHSYNNTGLYSVKLIIFNGNVSDTIVKTDLIDVLPNGIVNINNEFNATVYPNPNDGRFVLEINSTELKQFDIQLFNAIGEIIENNKANLNTSNRVEFDLEKLPAGVYYLKIIGLKNTTTKKIVVQ